MVISYTDSRNGRQNNSSKGAHVLMLRTCGYFRLHGKGELRLQTELWSLTSLSSHMEMILDYPGWTNHKGPEKWKRDAERGQDEENSAGHR